MLKLETSVFPFLTGLQDEQDFVLLGIMLRITCKC
jgi:hypothetical protein